MKEDEIGRKERRRRKTKEGVWREGGVKVEEEEGKGMETKRTRNGMGWEEKGKESGGDEGDEDIEGERTRERKRSGMARSERRRGNGGKTGRGKKGKRKKTPGVALFF